MKITLRKRYLSISAVLIALIIFMLVTGDSQKEKIRQSRALITVDTTELATYDYDVEMGYIGTLYAANEFAVFSKVAGRIVKMNYDIGDIVENGAVIAEIEDTQYQLEYKQARGKLDMEVTKVEQNQMAIDLAEREFERNTALRQEKVISESQLEKAQYDFERQKLNFELDQASLANQETSVEMSRLRLSYTKIEVDWGANDEGGTRVLADRFVDVGEIINTNKPIASIMEIGLLRAEIFVGEKEYPNFKIGMKVTIEVGAFPEARFEGVVERVAPFLNQQTRQAKVLISVKNTDMRLRPGMFALTNVTFSRREGVVMLPKECIMEWKNEDGVYVYDDENKQVLFRRVKVGDVHENNIEILNANSIDMPVVNVGQHMVRHYMKVNHVKDIQKEEPVRKEPVEKKSESKKKSAAKPDVKAKSSEKRAAAQKESAENTSAQDTIEESSSTPTQQTPVEKTVDPAEQSQAVPPKEPEDEVKPSTEKGTEG